MVKLITPVRRRRIRSAMTGAMLAPVALLAAGCSGTLEDVMPDRQPTYKSSRNAPPLEVPPDLTSTTVGDTLLVPEVDATYSQYASGEDTTRPRAATGVLPEIENARVERSGDERWLVVSMQPEDAWSRIRDFWNEQGFVIETEKPEVGIMETNWAAKRISLPAGFFKRLVNQLDDALYGVEYSDQFRTRIERGTESGTVEIYISHRGAEQTVVGGETPYAKREGLAERVWRPRPRDPGLEAEMLSRLMIHLGADHERASGIIAAEAAPAPRARLLGEGDDATAVALGENFSRAWRRTGLALDRAGFTVDDRDRSRGLFFVRYEDPEAGAESEKTSWLGRIKFWEKDDEAVPVDDSYLIRLIGEEAATRIVVLDREGNPEQSPAASRILTVLHEQLE